MAPLSPLSRRQFVTRSGTLAAALVLAPQEAALGLTSAKRAPLFSGGKFTDGVMSGDPTPNGIALWTRVDGVSSAGAVTLEVARDKSFKQLVTSQSVKTSAALNHAVKAQVKNLKPYEEYFYRFATKGHDSPVGRFRTALPAGSNQPVKFAFWSCQDYTHGFYNAHAAMAKDDLDFMICLGDYIYAETYHTTGAPPAGANADVGSTAVRDDKIGSLNSQNPQIAREAISLSDYRDKYELYRSDKHLQAIHAEFPMVTLWDDHEDQDNYAGGESDGGLPPEKHYSAARKKAAYRAFFESMPYFPPSGTDRIYRGLNFGDTVDLVVMDQRQYRKNQPCDDAVAPPCADWNQPRDFLGKTQMSWVKNRLKSSKATWKVMANEVTIMPTMVLGGSYFTYDAWQGYPQERQELLTYIRDQKIADVVFVTGDIHTFIAGDVRTYKSPDDPNGDNVAIEFVGGSITSQGLGETNLDAGGGVMIQGNDQNPSTSPGLIDSLRGINPWVDNADFDHHGYGKVTATKDSFKCEMVRMKTIKKQTTSKLPSTDWTYTLKPGQTTIKGVHGPSS